MPPEPTNAEAALTKLGQRVRAGWARQHPVSERSLETVRSTVRQSWEQEQKVKRARTTTPKPPSKGKGKGQGLEPEV
jgi:hypothetical protein